MIDITKQSLDGNWSIDDSLAATRRNLEDRIRDPFMTEHDRWVLGQFAKFLGGVAPDADPRLLHGSGTVRDPQRHLRSAGIRPRV